MVKMLATIFRTSAGRPQQLSTAVQYNFASLRAFQSSTLNAAIAHPVTAHGPPPKAPSPSPRFEKCTTQQSNTESEPQHRPRKRPTVLKKRFWKDVDVKQKDGGDYQVLLDKRPVRTPSKSVLSIPSTKQHLAQAIALEWDVMNAAQQALKNHTIPLTSLTARAADIAQEDAAGAGAGAGVERVIRTQIVKTAMRYLETDTLLCWVPEQDDAVKDEETQQQETLREAQMRVAKDVIAFLSTKVWPGIDIVPVLDGNSIFPASQSQATKDIIRQWVEGLEAYDLAGLERGILASKSLLVAVRLVTEWSENFCQLQQLSRKRFGIEEAAEASSLEVRWQTDMWGEVEDTHDVDKEDLKRQLGSVIVLVAGVQ
ncbi:ATP synthase complex assembly protein ATP12 [Aspergillus nidulans FGSC A4]|uniref:Mitochondrial molecular chaperone (Atp12), putative (AFU_orthologue AFUA_7G02490) n=1 Tax=Emericella nidulans (strain FGSC A4 / ATCC 38163 / CBS 112.46 / NRRL 194 / M139) TaxID=227321 RepID=C8VH85_EMENI|nr:ATP synthase complex assembly protein ATP12 [Aspergillus nidulans FGSC A4]CBF82624.1 TPA: mitochondrial molecular chaperone (Atp12), putative (AFU_orthologue; AFUA_7G02490) [Aspergillus nidulans FGSC A4]